LGPSLQMILVNKNIFFKFYFTCIYCIIALFFQKDNNRIGLPFLQVQKIAHQLVSALIFLHSNSCAHHDLKPDNIAFVSTRFEWNPENNQKMITSSEIKLLDFGSATFKSDKKSFFATTRQYRSPQMECNWSPKNDVWSLGCTLFEILTGKMLFPCVNNIEMIFMVEVLFGNIPLE
jgi:CDC-like kinase